MAKIDLDNLSIEDLAALREQATEKLAEKVAARQAELEAELEKLAQYRGLKKAATPAVKPKKDEPVKSENPQIEHARHELAKQAEPAAKAARAAA